MQQLNRVFIDATNTPNLHMSLAVVCDQKTPTEPLNINVTAEGVTGALSDHAPQRVPWTTVRMSCKIQTGSAEERACVVCVSMNSCTCVASYLRKCVCVSMWLSVQKVWICVHVRLHTGRHLGSNPCMPRPSVFSARAQRLGQRKKLGQHGHMLFSTSFQHAVGCDSSGYGVWRRGSSGCPRGWSVASCGWLGMLFKRGCLAHGSSRTCWWTVGNHECALHGRWSEILVVDATSGDNVEDAPGARSHSGSWAPGRGGFPRSGVPVQMWLLTSRSLDERAEGSVSGFDGTRDVHKTMVKRRFFDMKERAQIRTLWTRSYRLR